MRHFHTRLCETSPLYRRWHDHPSHPFVHWTLFVLVMGLFTQAFLTKVDFGLTQGLGTPSHAHDRILVGFRQSASQDLKVEVLARHGLRPRSVIAGIEVHVVGIPAGTLPEAAVAALLRKESASVEFAEVDAILEASLVPDDPWFANWQPDKTQIGAPAAWDSVTGDASHVIAIVDTGVNCAHEDLAANCVPGWNFNGKNDDARDVTGHGTKVAGTAAAAGNNGLGVAGMTWRSKIMPLRVSALDGTAPYSTIAEAVTYAADRGAKVVNASYKAAGSLAVRRAAKYLAGKGGILVVSAGNYGTDTGYDNDPNLISVSAVDPGDVLQSWSSFGGDVDVSAPGCTSATTQNGGGYGSFCGTSNAAPEVAGTLMLVRTASPALTAEQAMDVLFASAKDLGAASWDPSYGWGRIDAAAAVILAIGTATLPPHSDSNAFEIVAFEVTARTATTASIVWTTDAPSTGTVAYGAAADAMLSSSDGTSGTAHSVTLTGLKKNTTYSFRIDATRSEGGETVSAASTFRTKSR